MDPFDLLVVRFSRSSAKDVEFVYVFLLTHRMSLSPFFLPPHKCLQGVIHERSYVLESKYGVHIFLVVVCLRISIDI